MTGDRPAHSTCLSSHQPNQQPFLASTGLEFIFQEEQGAIDLIGDKGNYCNPGLELQWSNLI